MALKILYHTRFQKHFKERISPDRRLVEAYQEALGLYIEDPNNPVLGDHKLSKEQSDRRAFWITENIRITYRVTKDGVLLYDISTHLQVY